MAETTEPTYEVRVTLTVVVPYYDEHPGVRDAMDLVIAALRNGGRGILPDKTYLRGSINARVRTAKEIATDQRRAEKRKRESLHV